MALRHFLKNKLTLLACIVVVGCSSTHSVNTDKHSEKMVSISATELAQLKESAAQWQQAKPGVERLLIIEQDLKLLINQLNAVVAESTAAKQTEDSSSAVEQTQVTTPAETVKPKFNRQPIYALQVASVTEKVRLTKSVANIQTKAPNLFSGQFIANIEPVDVSGVTYYRLKLGAYQYQKNAKDDCEKLKAQQINCIVSHYSNNPIEF